MPNKITYGDRIFDDQSIKSGNLHRARSLLSSSLEIDTFEFVVRSDDTTLTQFQRNAPLTYYHDDMQMGIFYVQKVSRQTVDLYRFECTSTIGLLDESYHDGGIYTGQTVEEVVLDICGPHKVYIKSNLRSIRLYGWLPIVARRANLSQVLFAIGATLKVDYDGVLRVEGLWDGVSTFFTKDHMYTGGSVQYGTPVTTVNVTEHQYMQSPDAELAELFDGTAARGDKVTFDEPCFDLSASGFTILESGANYAVLSAGSGKLTGRKYTHTTRQVIKPVSRPESRDLVSQSDNTVTVTDATLISLVNANAVAQRLADYFACTERILNDMVQRKESSGDVTALIHPYGGLSRGCIESMDITISGILKARESILLGYTPPAIGEAEYYDHVDIITEDTVWNAPPGVTTARADVIGGGDGGGLGSPGEKGTSSWHNTNLATAGGESGIPGNGGKVFAIDLMLTEGQSFSVHIGRGGKGATRESPAQAGGATTFGNYSSDDGASSPNGFVDVINGTTYATTGALGVAGGHGQSNEGDGTNVVYNGVTYTCGTKGENDSYRLNSGNIRIAEGGFGGGPAAGANGGDGGDGKITGINHFADGGEGGAGATPVKAPNGVLRGQGGGGGHGGGGGGMGGRTENAPDSASIPGASGDPGLGGEGGDGADGCVLIYYRTYKNVAGGRARDKNNLLLRDKYKRWLIV